MPKITVFQLLLTYSQENRIAYASSFYFYQLYPGLQDTQKTRRLTKFWLDRVG